jgi:hypothetical protein
MAAVFMELKMNVDLKYCFSKILQNMDFNDDLVDDYDRI